MNMFKRISVFAEQFFNDQNTAQKAGEIMQAMIDTRSLRISDIASRMNGSEAACYKRVQRFLEENNPNKTLKLLFNEESEFVIGDRT